MRTSDMSISPILVFLLGCTAGHEEPATQVAEGELRRASGVVMVDGTPHPYLVEGEGVPCIVAGIAPFYPPIFSDELKQHIRFIYVDFKNTWMAEEIDEVERITMRTLVDEIDQIRGALGYERICVIGHSGPGFLPLEYAWTYPEYASHAVVIATPPFINATFLEAQEEFWGSDASEERKAAQETNVEGLPDSSLDQLTPRDQFTMRYVRNGPLFWLDPTYDSYWIWAGRHYSIEMVNHFFGVLVNDYDITGSFPEITTPVFLALGRYDYWCPYYLWDDVRDMLPNLSYHVFERSGHFPMFEEQALFDSRLIQWLEGS
jgi:proline iminopeptidase